MKEHDLKKYSGLFKIHGEIDLNDFFGPIGDSNKKSGNADADTIRLYLNPNSFEFQKNPNESFQSNLSLFDNAFFYDELEGKRKKILSYNTDLNRKYIRLRLQGIDAPELHYSANLGELFLYDDQSKKFTALREIFGFRQVYGAKTTYDLRQYLQSFTNQNQQFIKAYAFSFIDSPNDLFDRYGRAIVDVVIYRENNNTREEVNLNQWLVEQGLAFPDFYDSMSNEEIIILKQKSKDAIENKRGIWSRYENEIVKLDYEQLYEELNETQINNELGNLNYPKIFRKQVDYTILKRSGVKKPFVKTLKAYIKYRNSECYLVNEFLDKRHYAKKYLLAYFIDENGSFTNLENKKNILPGDLVNIESESIIETPNILNTWY